MFSKKNFEKNFEKNYLKKNKRGNPQRAATIGIWDLGDHTSKKNFESKVYPGDPQKKYFSTKIFFGKKQKLGKKILFLGVAHKTMEQ